MNRSAMGFSLGGLALALLAVPTTGAAQARGYVGFGPGLAVPLGTYGDAAKIGWLGQVVAGITGQGGKIGGRIDGMYVRNPYEGGVGHQQLIGVNASIVVTPGPRPAKLHPYLLAGGGFFNSKVTISGTGSDSETKPALGGGAGIQVHTGNRMDIYLEGRYLTVLTTGTNAEFIPIVLGVRWGGI